MAEEKRVCPNCNEEIEADIEKCPNCGETPEKEESAKSGFNKDIIKYVVIGLVVAVLVGIFGYMVFKSEDIKKADTIIQTHEDIYPYESTLSLKESVDIMVKEEKILEDYMSKLHTDKAREKVFYKFLNNLEYYTKTFSSGNLHRYTYSDNDTYAEHISISVNNRKLKHGKKDTIDGLEITPVFGGFVPLNVDFPNIKITNPEIPFVKLVFSGWQDSYYSNIPMFASGASVPTYFEMEPDYKYLNDKYSKYLGQDFKDYFKIKIDKQKTMLNGAFQNGNGGLQPAYVSSEDIEKWTNSLLELLNKYPDFILYDNVTEEIADITYPNYEELLKKIKEGTKLHKRIKELNDALDY